MIYFVLLEPSRRSASIKSCMTQSYIPCYSYTHLPDFSTCSMPVQRGALVSLDHPASLVQRIDNLLRKPSFRRVLAVLLQLRCTTDTKNDAIAHVKYGMVLAPPQRNLGKAQVVFFLERSSCFLGAVALIETKKTYRDALEQLKSPEIAFSGVTGAVHLTHGRRRIESTIFQCLLLDRTDLPRKESTASRSRLRVMM